MIKNSFSALYDYFSIKSIVDLIKFALPIYITYFVTKYSVNSPQKIAINKKQFQYVYLPLYKILCTSDTRNLSKKEVLRYAIRIKSIINRNYELAFPQLHSLLKDLFNQLEENKDHQVVFNKIKYQVSLDYEILKKKLGYPSQTSIEIFKRKTKKDKIRSVIGWISVVYLLSLFIIPYLIPTSQLLLSIVVYFLGLLFIIYINETTNKTKD